MGENLDDESDALKRASRSVASRAVGPQMSKFYVNLGRQVAPMGKLSDYIRAAMPSYKDFARINVPQTSAAVFAAAMAAKMPAVPNIDVLGGTHGDVIRLIRPVDPAMYASRIDSNIVRVPPRPEIELLRQQLRRSEEIREELAQLAERSVRAVEQREREAQARASEDCRRELRSRFSSHAALILAGSLGAVSLIVSLRATDWAMAGIIVGVLLLVGVMIGVVELVRAR